MPLEPELLAVEITLNELIDQLDELTQGLDGLSSALKDLHGTLKEEEAKWQK